MQLPPFPFTVLDTETTGLVPSVARVIEFASVRSEKGKVVDEYEQLIGIDAEVPDVVRVLTRIKTGDIAGKPNFVDALEEIKSHIGKDTLIVGQNVGFDIAMLKAEGIDLSERPWIDTSMLASIVFPELESYSLGYVSTVLKLKHEPVHRALGDVHATLELLSNIWERFSELPEAKIKEVQTFFSKSSPGYQIFAEHLSGAGKSTPKWLTVPQKKVTPNTADLAEGAMEKPQPGTASLVEEAAEPGTLQSIIDEAIKDTSTVHWVAVKNLEATVRKLVIPEGARVLHPPFLLLDPEQGEALQKQDVFTSDEASLALKLRWYKPKTQSDAPIHGDERSVWSGKLACTDESKTYTDQFTDLPSVILLDHRQLLHFFNHPEHVGNTALNENAHIIIDDASMLEDTATKAYGWYCNVDALRAAAAGHDLMTKMVDLLGLWIERTRNFQDVRYITPQDLSSPDHKGLREQVGVLLEDPAYADTPAQKQLEALLEILNPENLEGNIAWIEVRNDGTQFVQSVPEHIGTLLKETMYEKYPTTLFIPPDSDGDLNEVVPAGIDVNPVTLEDDQLQTLSISFPEDLKLEDILSDPPAGKTIILVNSRRSIEDFYVRYTEALEQRDVTLICQGLSGGQGRMQAEFTAAEGDTVWLITPWSFEGIELAPNMVDQLFMHTLAFDIPSHPVFSIRSEHYRDGFGEYSLPRLKHRLFRLIRTFRRFSKVDAPIALLDNRIHQKSYGQKIKGYLAYFMKSEMPKKEEGQMKLL